MKQDTVSSEYRQGKRAADNARDIRKAIKLLEASASAYEHGRYNTGYVKLSVATAALAMVQFPDGLIPTRAVRGDESPR